MCRFGRTPVVMNGVEWIDEKGQFITLRFIVGLVGDESKAILSLRAAGGSDEAVKGVLRHVAVLAEFIRSAQMEESTES